MTNESFTIHPIGQGLFYSAELSGVKLIYDCGSSEEHNFNFNRNNFMDYIEKFKICNLDMSKGLVNHSQIYEIDILVISHFDADHINGLETLLENTVVTNMFIPYSHENHMVALLFLIRILIAKNNTRIQRLYLVLDDRNRNLDSDINYEELMEDDSGFFDFEGNDDISESITEISNSGTTVRKYNKGNIHFKTNDYVLDFFNLEINKEEKACLKNKILQSIYYESRSLTEFINSAKRLYKDCIGTEKSSLTKTDFSNNSSLCLALVNKYSLTMKVNHGKSYYVSGGYFKSVIFRNRFRLIKTCLVGYLSPNTLLTGDIDLSAKKRYKRFNEHYNYLHYSLDVLILPHHGAVKNWNDGLLDYIEDDTTLVVSSSGLSNKYNHPSLSIEYKVLQHNGNNIRVNEMNGIEY